MLLGDAVDVMAQVEREVGHVQLAGATEDFVHVEEVGAPKDAPNVVERKSVVAGWHGSMRGEDTLPLDCLHILVVEAVAVKPSRPFVQQLQYEQCGVALVHVKAADFMVAERAEHPHAADAKDNFLAKPVVGVAAVKMMGERAVPFGIFREIGIQQNHRHFVAAGSFDHKLPCSDMDGSSFDSHLHALRKFATELCDVPRYRHLGLPAISVERLREVALPMQKRDRNQRQLEIGSGTNGVARQHSKAAAISGHSWVQG